ncbi:MAG: tetratricopeptide repeat protein, partial [Acidiferrobacterales bacterium]
YIHVIMGWVDDPDSWLADGMVVAKKALQCDDKAAVAYFAAGRIHMMRGEHDNSIAALETALELNPSFAQACHGLGLVLALAGKLDEAKGFFEKAEKLSPRDPLLWAFTVCHALTLILAGENEDALFWAHKTMQNPHSTGDWSHAVLAAASANLGRLDDARSAVARALKEKPDLTLSYLKKALPTKQEGGLEPYLSGLRKAGLPE